MTMLEPVTHGPCGREVPIRAGGVMPCLPSMAPSLTEGQSTQGGEGEARPGVEGGIEGSGTQKGTQMSLRKYLSAENRFTLSKKPGRARAVQPVVLCVWLRARDQRA